MAYTLADLEQAQQRLKIASDRVDNTRSNNPDRGVSALHAAMDEVDAITLHLKAQGLLSKSEHELLTEELDRAFPKARSKDIVEHKGVRYQLLFRPARMSRSRKSVVKWDRWWEKL